MFKKFNRWLQDRRHRKLALLVAEMFATCDHRAYRTANPDEQRRAPDRTGRLALKANALSDKLGKPINDVRATA